MNDLMGGNAFQTAKELPWASQPEAVTPKRSRYSFGVIERC
jgi:hypothetical protein